MKRKSKAVDTKVETSNGTKRRHLSPHTSSSIQESFIPDLFAIETVASYRNAYHSSSPYPHAVVPSLIDNILLRRVRKETSHISFTLKETDIYRIHQSGDLANLSGLDAKSLSSFPALVQLRDALYSHDFREWVSDVTGAGKLSGSKTDMAINIYKPGGYLLCHDDVIGSRRVSYILYLTDPDDPWQAEWGGGLRLHGTETKTKSNGEEVKVPTPEHTVTIPPAFSQLSFFAVRPGESYHDVEEVYHGKDPKEDSRRIRMAISGWYHIPQHGEEGYEEGAEEAQKQKSSLAQLEEGAADDFDAPKAVFRHFDEARVVAKSNAKQTEVDHGQDSDTEEEILTEQDLTFLLEYIAPSFLTPDMTEQLAGSFEENSVLQLDKFLSEKFATRLREYVERQELTVSPESQHVNHWQMARPPHKHRYLYLQDASHGVGDESDSPISSLLFDLLHSHAFKKWLALITGFRPHSLISQNCVARRFRRGKDYALASEYKGEQPQIEFTIGITPSQGWDGVEVEQREKEHRANGKSHKHVREAIENGKAEIVEPVEFGGEEVYIAGDDDESVHSTSLPQVGKKADPAVYKAAMENEDDGLLFTNSAAWNQLSIVLRDKGTQRFVKYVSQAANGDRWDIKGEVKLGEDAFDGEEENGADEEGIEEEDDDEEEDDGVEGQEEDEDENHDEEEDDGVEGQEEDEDENHDDEDE